MLNIPESVKTLFTRDDIRKNFRASFIREGLPDITNENVVTESVQFTESVCSQSSFCFGLAEASVIEFETVGVQNILGEQFDAWTEIDASTLPAELQTVRPDLNHPVYPVPLGRFIVTSCPRNHEAMARRKVRAMSYVDSKEAVLAGPLYTAIRKPFITQRGNSTAIAFSANQLTKAFSFETIEATEIVGSASNAWKTYPEASSDSIRLGKYYADRNYSEIIAKSRTATTEETLPTVRLQYTVYQPQMSVNPNTGALFTTNLPEPDDVNVGRIIEELAQQYMSIGGYYINTVSTAGQLIRSIPATAEKITEIIENVIKPSVFLPRMTIGIYPVKSSSRIYEIYKGENIINYPAGAPLPFGPRPAVCYGDYTWKANYAIKGPGGMVYAVTPEFREQHEVLEFKLLAEQPPAEHEGNLITIDSTATGTTELGEGIFAFDTDKLKQLAMAAIELSGKFGAFTRDGKKTLKALSNEPETALEPSKYDSAWWDEYDLAPVGTIAYKLANADFIYQFGEGPSSYIFQNNEVFNSVKNITQEKAEALMAEFLVPALQELNFTPAEIDAQGMPYLEAGDCVELEADDGTTIKTYVLRRQLSGIQRLTDNITADGITIAEVTVE